MTDIRATGWFCPTPDSDAVDVYEDVNRELMAIVSLGRRVYRLGDDGLAIAAVSRFELVKRGVEL